MHHRRALVDDLAGRIVTGHIDMAGDAPMVVPLGRCRERDEPSSPPA